MVNLIVRITGFYETQFPVRWPSYRRSMKPKITISINGKNKLKITACGLRKMAFTEAFAMAIIPLHWLYGLSMYMYYFKQNYLIKFLQQNDCLGIRNLEMGPRNILLNVEHCTLPGLIINLNKFYLIIRNRELVIKKQPVRLNDQFDINPQFQITNSYLISPNGILACVLPTDCFIFLLHYNITPCSPSSCLHGFCLHAFFITAQQCLQPAQWFGIFFHPIFL